MPLQQITSKTNYKQIITRELIKTGIGTARNNPCYCGSQIKYKKCHMLKEQSFVKTDKGYEKAVNIQTPVAYNLGNSIGGKK